MIKRNRTPIREEQLKGLQDFMLQQATDKFIEELKQHIIRYVLSSKSSTSIEQKQSLMAANDVLNDLRVEVNELLQQALFQFTRRV